MNVRHIVLELPNTSQPHKISSGEEDQAMAAHWSDEATTTGDSSDNDSASESDGESHGNASRKRHASLTAGPVEGRLPPSDSCWQSHEVQHPQRRRQRLKQQPLPREVDYTFRSADLGRKPLTPVAGPESAPLGQNTMGVAQRAALDQRQGLQASSRAATKLLLMTTTPPSGSRTASSKEVRRADGLVCKKRTTPPVKGGDNINAPVPRRPIPAFRGRSGQRDGSADSNAAAELMPPPLSKDRTSSSLPPFDGRRSRIPSSNSGSSSEGCCFWPRSTRAARLSPIRRLPRKEPATVMGEAVPDLACYEVLDMDAVMLSGGEVRRPICRYLLPCWPEGVEGYEEVGGWRRLGVATTPDSSQEGRRRV
ncbi:unnamed protein product [Ascophyllum nodosum]